MPKPDKIKKTREVVKMPRHFGSIRKLPSGRYQASYLNSADKRTNAPETFKLKRDAEKWLATVEADKVRGILRQPKVETRTLTVYGQEWLENREKPLKPLTREHYERYLRNWIFPELGGVLITEIDSETVRKWHASVGRKTGPAAQSMAYQILKAILNTATNDDLIPFNPCKIKGAGRRDSAERNALSVSQVMDLANAVPKRYKVLVLLAAFGGLRISELLGLRRCDVDLEAGTVTVSSQLQRIGKEWVRIEPKSIAGRRTVSLPTVVVDALRDHFDKFVFNEDPRASVFSTSTGRVPWRTTLRDTIARAGKRIGQKDVFPHLLRHSGLTFFAQQGATNAELLARGGHSSIQVAMIYQHATPQRDHELANRLNERILSH